ncbi:hypothetical protein M422DRAFT_32465 [Sphaerobolus stellatus SS14]|uniref:Uncharacterized protein n=1 Tax=Sphaerobolus stellatus (strain SS14) TaxID=990650 RepID=A0A0C9UYA1_SPHS4|nr:hypothetical protein M422DRAFT_32465 [Sphaerobolus stellatus SS14]
MPSYDVTVDDSSPMVIYSDGWIDSNFTTAPSTSYFGGTRHITGLKNANATLSFYGNGISVYGTRGTGYGSFSVLLDGQNQSASTSSSGNDSQQFQQLLFSKSDFVVSAHTVTIINDGNGDLDLDYVVFAAGNGDPTVEAMNITVDDSSSQISYSPRSAWRSVENATYFDNSLRVSNTNGSEATFSFLGDAVSVYGTTGPDHGIFSVQMDNQSPMLLNASASESHTQTLLFFIGGLRHGQHTIKITNKENATFGLDVIGVSSWSSPVQFPSSFKHLSTANIPVIAGVLSGACVIIFWSIAAFLWLRRRRRRKICLRSTADRPEETVKKAADFIVPPDPAIVEGLYEPGYHLFKDKKEQAKARRTHSSGQRSQAEKHDPPSRVESYRDAHETEEEVAKEGERPSSENTNS